MFRSASSRSAPRPRTLTLCVLIMLCPWLLAGSVAAQTWETAANNPSDPKFVQMPYEVVFVSSPIIETETCSWEGPPDVWNTEPRGVYEIGTDVLGANRPSQGNQLWVVTRNGAVKLLFPLPVHQTQTAVHPDTGLTVPLIDTPNGMLELGSVVEPNVSEDGERIIFGYFHDTSFHVGSGQGNLAKQGADLYTLDLSTMVQASNPDLIDPATLPVRRLTFKEYDGSGAQSDVDKNKDAQNPVAADTSGNNGWGTVNIHGTEMRTRHGLKMVYVSGDRRNMNSNESMFKSNYNLNLKIADINNDGSLGATRQFQYYTTTSAISPTPLRNGVAFSYQATTEDGRNWHIQYSDSEGRWGPLIGYGTNPDLFHLGAFCVDTQGDSHGNGPGDYFIATKYYNLNNNGFGALWKIDMDQLGLNTYDNWSQWGDKPAQVSARKISLNVEDRDFPSAIDPGTGLYYGKMTTPRCGRPDELFFAYTPTSANGKSATCEPNEGNNIYRSYIGFRPNFEDFQPLTDISILVNDSDDVVNAIWPVPVLNHLERTGDAQQQVGNSIIGRRSVVTPGAPYAQVGTSSLYNTDRKPYDCWLGTMEGCPNCCGVQQGGQTYYAYNPNKLKNNQKEQIWSNFDALSFVQDSGDFCQDLAPSSVLGIAVNITSNRIDHDLDDLDYHTDGHGQKETARLLGVYDVRQQGDQSFQAMIPSHTPFEFHLLESKYGLRAVDVRSWHSLYPREVRTNCGGCHQHEVGQAQPFQGTVAASQPPLDMVNQTQRVTYDANCRVRMAVDTTKATEEIPEWKADIYPQFDQYCGTCHNSTVSTDALALGALSYANESVAYTQLKTKNYANSKSGALSSPAFWAARGERTDGRDNSLYQAGAVCGSNPTFAHSSGHGANPNLCGQGNLTMAQWVYRLGQWIDNHMPRDTGTGYAAKHDRYHPAMDIAAIDGICQASKLRVGYWDDSGSLAKVEVLLNGLPLAAPVLNVANGSHVINGLSLSNGDRVQVIGEDGAGNRQMYEKRVKELKTDCSPTQVVVVPGPAVPLP